ncbi:restriction endonuclease [Streptomyces sp. NPDC004561]
MTIPTRPVRRVPRDRRFDLRTTALFFMLLAIILCLLAFLVRTAAGIVERRPLWAAALATLGIAAAVMSRSGWRRLSAGRCARKAARALHEAAERASGSLDATPVADAGLSAPQVSAFTEPFTGAAPTGTGGDEVRLRPEGAPVVLSPQGVGGEERTVPLDYTELDPDGFEQAVADLCARDGCLEVEVVGGAGDLGADVVAITADGRRVVVQCKQYGDTHKVGSQDMQRFGGTCFTIHEADIAALITTSEFTTPALEYARQCGIVCMDGHDLETWRHGTGPAPWHRTDVEPWSGDQEA